MDAQRNKGRSNKMLSPTIASMLVLASVSQSIRCHLTPTSAFSFPPIVNRAATSAIQLAPKSTICHAKSKQIASNFDLDEILANEKKLSSTDEETVSASNIKGHKRSRNKNKNNKKKIMKEQFRVENLEKAQSKLKLKKDNGDDALQGDANDESDDDAAIDNADLIRNIDFLAFEVPSSLEGKRIDAVLVDLLNKDKDEAPNSLAISRSQCGTLLSNECVFIVPPEGAKDFLEARQGESTVGVPHNLIEEYSSPIQRKSHPLETSSILVYPSRTSLLSKSSSSTLLSNFIPPTEIVAQNIPLDILYEDEQMIVLNKKAGMVVHPAAGNWDGTLVNALAYYLMNESPFGAGEFFTDDEKDKVDNDDKPSIASDDADVNQNDSVTNSISTLRPGIVHRLDKGTTGVIVVAKTSSALATLSEAFAERKVKKQYLAVAIGNPGEDQWINKPIGRHPLHRQRMRVVPDPSSSISNSGQARLTGARSAAMLTKQGRPALSHIHTVHHDGKLSIVQVKIATGRTHQIRVHLQDHGTPVYGDDVYGLSDWNKALSSRRGVMRPLLHAQRLEIDHPVTGENMVFEAEVADDMMGVIKAIWPAGQEIQL